MSKKFVKSSGKIKKSAKKTISKKVVKKALKKTPVKPVSKIKKSINNKVKQSATKGKMRKSVKKEVKKTVVKAVAKTNSKASSFDKKKVVQVLKAKPASPVKKITVKAKAKKIERITKIVAIKKPVNKPIAVKSKVAATVVETMVKSKPKPKTQTIVRIQPVKTIAQQLLKASNGKHETSVIEKGAKEPQGKFELEYVVRASPQILFDFLTSPSGLSEWFCDDVNIRNGVYSFVWEGSEQQAKLVKNIEDRMIRFQWLDKPDGSYFEFRIEKDDLTSDISLIVTDFSDTPDDAVSSRLLWNSQIDKLLHVLGSYF